MPRDGVHPLVAENTKLRPLPEANYAGRSYETRPNRWEGRSPGR